MLARKLVSGLIVVFALVSPVFAGSAPRPLLAPEKGAMLGAFVFEVDGRAQSQAERVAAFEKLTGRKQASILSYLSWDDTGLDDVLAGKHDAYIDRFARDAKAWGGPVLLRFLHPVDVSGAANKQD